MSLHLLVYLEHPSVPVLKCHHLCTVHLVNAMTHVIQKLEELQADLATEELVLLSLALSLVVMCMKKNLLGEPPTPNFCQLKKTGKF